MNLSQVDEKILQLMNQYSINGNITPESTNEDYLLRTRNFIDMCQKELADEFPIIKEETWIQVASNNATDFATHPIPNNCEKILSIILNKYPELKPIDYKLLGNNILLDPYIEGNLVCQYQKIPDAITKDTLDTTELEIGIKFQELIAFYVAGWIYLEDNPTVGTMLLNEYKEKKNRINKNLPATPISIIDVYENSYNYLN